MIFIKKQLEIYTLSLPYKMGFMTSVSFCFGARPRFVLVCQFPVANLHSWIWWVVKGRRCSSVVSVAEMHISKALSLSTKICYAGDRPIWGKSDSGLNQGNFCLWNLESWVFQCGIHLKLWRIRNPLTIGIQNPSATDKGWNPVPGIRNSWRGIQNPSLSWIPLELVLERSSIFSFPHSPLPCACGQKIPPPGFISVRALDHLKRENQRFCEQATETQVTFSLLVVVLVSFCVSFFLMILVYLAPHISGLVSL